MPDGRARVGALRRMVGMGEHGEHDPSDSRAAHTSRTAHRHRATPGDMGEETSGRHRHVHADRRAGRVGVVDGHGQPMAHPRHGVPVGAVADAARMAGGTPASETRPGGGRHADRLAVGVGQGGRGPTPVPVGQHRARRTRGDRVPVGGEPCPTVAGQAGA